MWCIIFGGNLNQNPEKAQSPVSVGMNDESCRRVSRGPGVELLLGAQSQGRSRKRFTLPQEGLAASTAVSRLRARALQQGVHQHLFQTQL